MLRREGDASAESSSSTNYNGGQRQGTWLSTGEPKKYKCSFCHLSFHSMNALGGHQNAHRQQRNQMQKLMNTDRQSPKPLTSKGDASSKKKTFYEFMPLKEGHAGIYGYGGAFQNPLHHNPQYGRSFLFRDANLHVMMPGAVGSGGFLESPTSSGENGVPFRGGLNAVKGASMSELDLTLKL